MSSRTTTCWRRMQGASFDGLGAGSASQVNTFGSYFRRTSARSRTRYARPSTKPSHPKRHLEGELRMDEPAAEPAARGRRRRRLAASCRRDQPDRDGSREVPWTETELGRAPALVDGQAGAG